MILTQQFDGNSIQYRQWKADRLELQNKQSSLDREPISLTSTSNCNPVVLSRLCDEVKKYGYALYEWNDTPADVAAAVEKLHSQLALTQHDAGVVTDSGSLALLKDLSGSARGKFIPYTSKAMSWHTDGYYNDQTQSLRCFTLHCISPAAKGGSLSLIDYELLFIALYDEAPDLITLLSHPNAMTLPANKDRLGHDRPDRHAPVFFCYPDGSLGARFTTRTKNIQWRNTQTKAAAEQATEVLNKLTDWHQTRCLQSGQGIITRNILHSRGAFVDDPSNPPRQMLRGRYLQLPVVHNA